MEQHESGQLADQKQGFYITRPTTVGVSRDTRTN
jgi:hypothetical protein